MSDAVDLVRIFAEWNLRSFEGQLPRPVIRFNSRLQTTAGRFIAARRSAVIEIATYLLDEENAEKLIRDTLGHEMIHYWLWCARRPFGHTQEFWNKMTEMGVSRFNPVPRHRPYKHEYLCPHCKLVIKTRRTMKRAACGACCNEHAGGQFDSRFVLEKSA